MKKYSGNECSSTPVLDVAAINDRQSGTKAGEVIVFGKKTMRNNSFSWPRRVV